MKVDTFFDSLWRDYTAMTPQAEQIQQAFANLGETVINDHVAFRTFNHGPIRLEDLEKFLLEMGYRRNERYRFEAKKLVAYSYLPPVEGQPLIFLSELQTQELSEGTQAIIRDLTGQIDPTTVSGPEVFWTGRLWQAPSWEQYQALAKESEYAAWMAIHGLRVNHFTVSVNELNGFKTLSEVNDFVTDQGHTLNTVGGIIKGSEALMLEQSATMASIQSIEFANGERHDIPTCFYEFAQRFNNSEGKRFMGFVEGNADKIFESTHSGHSQKVA